MSSANTPGSSTGIATAQRAGSLLRMKVVPFDFAQQTLRPSLSMQRQMDFVMGVASHRTSVDDLGFISATMADLSRDKEAQRRVCLFPLRFENPQLEAKYMDRVALRSIKIMQLFCAIGLFIVTLYLLTKPPELAPGMSLSILSLADVILALVIALLLKKSLQIRFYHQAHILTLVAIILTSLIMSYSYRTDPIPRYHVAIVFYYTIFVRTVLRRSSVVIISANIAHCIIVHFVYETYVPWLTLIASVAYTTVLIASSYFIEIHDRQCMIDEEEIESCITELSLQKLKAAKLIQYMYPGPVSDIVLQHGSHIMPAFEQRDTTLLVFEISFPGFEDVSRNSKAIIDHLYSANEIINQVLEKYDLDKIKSYGRRCLAVGGLLRHNPTAAAFYSYRAAKEAIEAFRDNDKISIRAHLHGGPVFGFVLGAQNRCFDIYGTAVEDVMNWVFETDKISCNFECSQVLKTATASLMYRCTRLEEKIYEIIEIDSSAIEDQTAISLPHCEPTFTLKEQDLYSVDKNTILQSREEEYTIEDQSPGSMLTAEDQEIVLLNRKDYRTSNKSIMLGLLFNIILLGINDIILLTDKLPEWGRGPVLLILMNRFGFCLPTASALTMSYWFHSNPKERSKAVIQKLPIRLLRLYGLMILLNNTIAAYTILDTTTDWTQLNNFVHEQNLWVFFITALPTLKSNLIWSTAVPWGFFSIALVIFNPLLYGLYGRIEIIRYIFSTPFAFLIGIYFILKQRIRLAGEELKARVNRAKQSLLLEKEIVQTSKLANTLFGMQTIQVLNRKLVHSARIVNTMGVMVIRVEGLSNILEIKSNTDKARIINDVYDTICNQASLFSTDFLYCVGGKALLVSRSKDELSIFENLLLLAQKLHEAIAGIGMLSVEDRLKLKVGIHIGSCLFGTSGKTRYVNDVWGPTVEECDKLCSSCSTGKTQVSSALLHLGSKMQKFRLQKSNQNGDSGIYVEYIYDPWDEALASIFTQVLKEKQLAPGMVDLDVELVL